MVFDTWIAASDRKNEHVLVADDGDATSLGLAYIDYAFSLSYEWTGKAGRQPDPRPHWPNTLNAATKTPVTPHFRTPDSH